MPQDHTTLGDSPLLLRQVEAATLLGLSKTTIERLVARGELPSVEIGTARRVKHSDLVAWVQSLEVAP